TLSTSLSSARLSPHLLSNITLVLHTNSSLFFFQCSAAHPDLHSFPTRRSSDLHPEKAAVEPRAQEMPQVGVDHAPVGIGFQAIRSEEHTSELQSRENLVCRLLLEKKKKKIKKKGRKVTNKTKLKRFILTLCREH